MRRTYTQTSALPALQLGFAGSAILAAFGTAIGFALAQSGFGWRAQLAAASVVMLACTVAGTLAENAILRAQRAEIARIYAAALRGQPMPPQRSTQAEATPFESLAFLITNVLEVVRVKASLGNSLFLWATAMRSAVEKRGRDSLRIAAGLGEDAHLIATAATASRDSERAIASLLQQTRGRVDGALGSTDAVVEEAEALTDAVRATTAQAKRSAQLASRMSEAAFATQQGVSAMTETAAAMVGATEQVKAILKRAEMLGLNAGIEAARAGEAGRGFAVVATEVKALAQHGAAALEAMQTTMQDLKSQAAHAFERVESISDVIQAQHEFGHALQHAAALQSDAVSRLLNKLSAARGEVGAMAAALRELDPPENQLGCGPAAQQAVERLPGYAEAMSQILRGLPELGLVERTLGSS